MFEFYSRKVSNISLCFCVPFLKIRGKEASRSTLQSCSRRRNIKGGHQGWHKLNRKEPRQIDALNPFNPLSGH